MTDSDDDSGEDRGEEKPDKLQRSAPPVVGGGFPEAAARCSECGVMEGRKHREGCKNA